MRQRQPRPLRPSLCCALSWTLAAVSLCIAVPMQPQVAPNLHWRTIRTAHFFIDFPPSLEQMARRAAADAERAYAELRSELHPPRGMVDIVISDDVDFSNGSATPFPTNRIIVYANPPIGESALRYTDDWTEMVITHELTHIFHLDRTRGIWSVAQHVFGRAATLFPNLYMPSWLDEGLAVYYETHFTGAGRIEGSEHRMIARASAIDHSFPRLDQVSLANPRFPFGETAYAYGSLFIDYLARTRGEESIHRFIEKSSAALVPIWLDRSATIGFGVSFSKAFAAFRDSIIRGTLEEGGTSQPMSGWRQLTTDGVFVSFPRWISGSALIYSGTPGRESFGAYRVGLDGRRTRVGRRNSRTPNVPLPDGSLLFSQIDFVNPYQQRNDIWVQRRGREVQLTHGQRLGTPDARARDGAIIAVQIVPGGTRLARVSSDGALISPLTAGTLDEQWTEPRWSNRGDRIAASRWRRGGVSDIVVLDTTGVIIEAFAAGHSTQATPVWTTDDGAVAFSSDRSGATEIYLHVLAGAGAGVHPPGDYLLSNSATGIFEPQIRDSAGSQTIAAVDFRGDGYHLGVGTPARFDRVPSNPFGPTEGSRPLPPVVSDTTPSTSYSPWRTLWPRYWVPTLESGIHDRKPRIGGTTTGYDVVARHVYSASVSIPIDNSGTVGGLDYAYNGLGLPVVELFVSQDWSRLGPVVIRTQPRDTVGEVRRRIRDAQLSTTWIRQRTRTAMFFTSGVGVERREYRSEPSTLIQAIDTTGLFSRADFPRLFVGAGFANTQRPPYSISPEDGITAAFTARDRLRSAFGASGPMSLSVVGAGSGFKSLDLPGFAHHVVALHLAAGWEDAHSNAYFEVGGNSGNSIAVVPGYTVGEGRRTFPVRGFAAASLFGSRAYGGTLEYRVPLTLASGGIGLLPFFFERSSLTLFGDAASAWCPSIDHTQQVCYSPEQAVHHTIASAGGELSLNAAVLAWDAPERLRVGVAVPVQGRVATGTSALSLYFAAGFPF